MSIFEKLVKITIQIFFVIIFFHFSTSNAKILYQIEKADKISNYFSGILLLNQSKFQESYSYLKKLDGLEKSHLAFSKKYLYSLVNSGNFNQAFAYSKKLEKEKQDNFESDLVRGVYFLKNRKFDQAKKYFLQAKNRKNETILNDFVSNSLFVWSGLNKEGFEKSRLKLVELDDRFENLKKIQTVFLNCYFDSGETLKLFNDLSLDEKTDFSRYNYFYAKYLERTGQKNKAKKVIENSLEKHPRNLLINQYQAYLDNAENNFDFNCKKVSHVSAEILYITANALSSQSIYSLSNFYLNLSRYLNSEFKAFDVLLAENFYKIEDYSKAKKIYKKLENYGSAFKWHSNKQLSRILILENKKDKSLNLLKKAYEELPKKGIYETFDYAEFLKNNKLFQESIIYYTNILKVIKKNHPLYPEVTDSRGVSYERTGEWEKAEKDLLSSLEISPDQAYVINYLAYSWIEQGTKIEKSLEMLKKANRLKSNDPYIIDSLGWALYKLERFVESKEYLQLAVILMPADPIVNDHYGDVLWKNGEEIQARYYWNYVLNLEKTEEDLKKKIEMKIIKGL